MESYCRFTDWLESTNTAFTMNVEHFLNGVQFLTFDLMENCGSDQPAEESLLTGFVDISVEFTRALAEESVMVVYAISPDVIDVSKERAARYTRVIV